MPRRSFMTPDEHAMLQNRMGTMAALSPQMQAQMPAAGVTGPGWAGQLGQAGGMGAAAAGIPAPAMPQAGLMAPAPPPDAPQIAALQNGPALPGTMADYARQNMNAVRAAGLPNPNRRMAGSALAGFGLGASTGSPIAAGVGAGMGMLAEHLKQRRAKKPMATGGIVRLAMGGAGKERKDYPKTIPPPKKQRGMGLATRGHNFKGVK